MAVLDFSDSEEALKEISCSAPPPDQCSCELEDVLLVSATALPAESEFWPVRAVEASSAIAVDSTTAKVLCGPSGLVENLLRTLPVPPIYLVTDSYCESLGGIPNVHVDSPDGDGWAEVDVSGEVSSAESTWAWELTVAAICSRHVASIPSMILRHACDAPDAIAVVDAAGQLSYRALCSRAWQLGGELVARGCGEGERVGVLLSPSALTTVCLLGLGLRRFVPTTLSALESARRQQLSRAMCRVMLAEGSGPSAADDGSWSPSHVAATAAERPPSPPTPLVVLVDALPLNDEAEPRFIRRQLSDAGRRAASTVGDVAFIDWTSGSTGAPKGMATTQFKMAHWTRWRAYHFPLRRFGRRVAIGLFFPWCAAILRSDHPTILPSDHPTFRPSYLPTIRPSDHLMMIILSSYRRWRFLTLACCHGRAHPACSPPTMLRLHGPARRRDGLPRRRDGLRAAETGGRVTPRAPGTAAHTAHWRAYAGTGTCRSRRAARWWFCPTRCRWTCAH